MSALDISIILAPSGGYAERHESSANKAVFNCWVSSHACATLQRDNRVNIAILLLGFVRPLGPKIGKS